MVVDAGTVPDKGQGAAARDAERTYKHLPDRGFNNAQLFAGIMSSCCSSNGGAGLCGAGGIRQIYESSGPIFMYSKVKLEDFEWSG
jgi:hypothetical protein